MEVEICRIHPDAALPEYMTAGAACFDIPIIEDYLLEPGEVKDLRTGLVFRLPAGFALIVQPRSSSPKHGYHFPHSIGVIDSDYCGPTDELFLRVRNFSDKTVELTKGQRVAQGYITELPKIVFKEITQKNLGGISRGGFGSTGTH